MFPSDVLSSSDYYSEWYGPVLAQMGEKPLAELAERDAATHIRFTFFPGVQRRKGPVATTIRMRIPETGKAHFVVKRLEQDREIRSTSTLRRSSLSKTQAQKIEELGNEAGVWAFRSGVWQSNPDAIYVHCTELIMERAKGQDYSVSHVLISCEQPQKLMPLVDFVVDLARLTPATLNYSR